MMIQSPCKSICKLDTQNDWCTTCYRTTFEISRWTQMEPHEREAITENIIPNRRLKAEAKLLDNTRKV